MYMFASKSGAIIVADSNTFVSFEVEGMDSAMSALILQTVAEIKPVTQTHGSVGGEVSLNIFGEDAMIIRMKGLAVGKNCKQAQQATSAVTQTIEFFKDYSVLGRVQPLKYRLGSQKKRQGYLVAASVSIDSNMKDVANFDFVLLSEPLTDVPEIGDLPTLPESPATTNNESLQRVKQANTATSQSAVSQYATRNPTLIRPNGDLVTSVSIPVRTVGPPSTIGSQLG